ncbi:MAG: primosomal protein N' [Candidatus Pacebacteria bacterium]|nr:primosomal protein N' [Candidatus Paceibacterota bacterium]
MKIVTVIPLSKGVFKDQLSYFTSSEVSVGSLVTVPIRKKMIHALVTNITDAQTIKAQVKSAPFSIKKIEKVRSSPIFSEDFMKVAQKTADYFATTPGAVIESVIPKSILEAYGNNDLPKTNRVATRKNDSLKNEPYIFQSNDNERMSTYKSFIRESFAKQNSVFFCLPSAQKIEHVYNMLEKGIASYTYVLHSKLPKKEIVTTWKKVLTSKHPVLIIATGNFLAIPRNDIGAIILDFENSTGYKMIQRPFIDYRIFVEKYAEQTKIKLVFGDVFLRVETLEREKGKEFIAFAPLKFRMLQQSRQHMVDMEKQETDETKKTFTILSKDLNDLIEYTKENNEHLLLLTSRRGLNPVTLCGDCGTLVRCASCSAPMTLHKKDSKQIFICHKCGSRKTAKVTCENCGSWKLVPLGIGSQLTEKEVVETHPDAKVFRLDSDNATTHKRAATIASDFKNTPGSILIGTEMALSYMPASIDNVAVVSIDSLFALPDFRGNERIFNLLLRLYNKATKNFVIQTRNADAMIFEYLIKGNLMDFYRNEIAERKDLDYPPFKTFIKITLEGKKETVTQEMKKLTKELSQYDALAFPAFIQKIKGKYRMHMLIKLNKQHWVDKKLLLVLRSLPPSFNINVDPENLL